MQIKLVESRPPDFRMNQSRPPQLRLEEQSMHLFYMEACFMAQLVSTLELTISTEVETEVERKLVRLQQPPPLQLRLESQLVLSLQELKKMEV
ncbi:hypothetical protein MHYP_G00091150 [Metynnis hypsauchen]